MIVRETAAGLLSKPTKWLDYMGDIMNIDLAQLVWKNQGVMYNITNFYGASLKYPVCPKGF